MVFGDNSAVSPIFFVASMSKFRKNVNCSARNEAIVRLCLFWCDHESGKLVDGSIAKIAKEVGGVSRTTVDRVWKTYRKRTMTEGLDVDIKCRKAGNCGRKSKLTPALRELYRSIAQEYANLWLRLSNVAIVREMGARGISISRSTVQQHLKILKAHKVNLRIKPLLTEAHKEARCKWVLDKADRSHGVNRPIHYFQAGFNTVHVDESWFFLQRVSNQVLVFDGINVPDAPTTQHKSHIVKVMFLVALARPFMHEGVLFDGKIGMWPCTEITQAKRRSKNREKGADVVKSRNVDSEFYLELFTKQGGVIDAIKQKFEPFGHRTIHIQQDGARPHTGNGVVQQIEAYGSTDGWEIVVDTQPAQSPDLNILDLGFFHSLKVHVGHLKHRARNMVQLMANVREAFDDYDYDTLNRVWAHLFACYNCILAVNGDNQYTAPHSGVRTRQKKGLEVVDLTINVEEYNRVSTMLNY